MPSFKGASAHEEIRERDKNLHLRYLILTAQRRGTAWLQTCLTMQNIIKLFPPPPNAILIVIRNRRKNEHLYREALFYLLFLSSFSLQMFTFTFVCFLFGVVSSRSSRFVPGEKKRRIRDILNPSHSENSTALFLTVIPAEILEISLILPLLPFLLNEMAATAPPLGSISRPLCWQKKQQITFTWIVRFIIISRWQSLHYNAAEKRLTSFQIKIYNANTHL